MSIRLFNSTHQDVLWCVWDRVKVINLWITQSWCCVSFRIHIDYMATNFAFWLQGMESASGRQAAFFNRLLDIVTICDMAEDPKTKHMITPGTVRWGKLIIVHCVLMIYLTWVLLLLQQSRSCCLYLEASDVQESEKTISDGWILDNLT